MLADLVNGSFEALGAVTVWQNVRAIRRDRKVMGVDWRVTMFFTSWGIWNLYYYPSLGQWLSFAGGISICAMNIIWLYYAIALKRDARRDRVTSAGSATSVN